MGRVDFHAVVAGLLCPDSGVDKGLDDALDIALRHFPGKFRLALDRSGPRRIGNSTGTDDFLPRNGPMGSTAGMADLCQDGYALSVDSRRQALQSGNIGIGRQRHLVGTGPAFRRNETVFLNDQAWTAAGHITIISDQPIRHLAFRRLFRRHRRQDQTVLQNQRPNIQRFM